MKPNPQNTTTATASSKGDRTREKIFQSAMEVFKNHGYHKSTMRQIAQHANVSLGNSYYYFPSKESIVLEFYGKLSKELETITPKTLKSSEKLKERLAFFMRQRFSQLKPYEKSLDGLVGNVLNPKSSLSAFSIETDQIRLETVGHLDKIIKTSKEKTPVWFQENAPVFLWLWHMAMIYYWFIDRSNNKKSTFKLIDHSTTLGLYALKALDNRFIKNKIMPIMDLVLEVVDKRNILKHRT